MKTLSAISIGGRLVGEVKAGYALLERNINLTRRYLGWEICFLVYSMVSTFAIGLIGKTVGDEHLIMYLVVGALMWSLLSSIYSEVSYAISWERWEGTLEFTFMAPVHRLTHLVGVTSFAVLYGLMRTVLVLVAASWFFGLSLSNANIPGALIILAAGWAPMAGLGLIVAILPLLSAEKGDQASHIILGVILLVSGVYYPIEELPTWLQPLGRLSPVSYALNGVRNAVLEGTPTRELLPTAAMLLVVGAVLIPIGYAVFVQGERYAKRHGLISRDG